MAIKTANTTVNSGTRIDGNRDGFFDYLTYSGLTAKVNTGSWGFNYGYIAGGASNSPVSPTTGYSIIERWPFAASAVDSTDVGDITINSYYKFGQSSLEHGYTAGGLIQPGGAGTNVIDRFPFAAATTNATDVGDLLDAKNGGSSQESGEYGYASGGATPTATDRIERFPFAVSTTNTSDVGNLTAARVVMSGTSSETHGYSAGSYVTNVIERFPFATSTTDATDVGDLTQNIAASSGSSSTEYGYRHGGYFEPVFVIHNVIDRWPFAATTTNATDVGDLIHVSQRGSGESSYEYGYRAGGLIPPGGAFTNVIQRWPFSSLTTNASDVGNLTFLRADDPAGLQY